MNELAVLLKVFLAFGLVCTDPQIQYNPAQKRHKAVYLRVGETPEKEVNMILVKTGMTEDEERGAILHELVHCDQVERARRDGVNLPKMLSPMMEVEAWRVGNELAAYLEANPEKFPTDPKPDHCKGMARASTEAACGAGDR